ncbi:MAG: T9SS type A sorting domain-containing protein [Firmicutes bacterium]|nr:T9SS type A sorting domain-containing protein [Bacillota bacterium]
MEVFDVFGRKLIEQKAEGRRQKEIDITEFSLGVYFVKITTEKGVIVKKVVKQ